MFIPILPVMNQPQEREPFASLVLYHLFKWSIVSPTLHSYFRGRVYGVENVPQRNSLIIVCNHASYFDPPLLSCAVGRPVAYMAKEELFQIPILKQAIALYGAYPVKRGSGDRGAIRAAMGALESGWAVGVFLEGTRTNDGLIHEPKLGAAMIAAKTGVPLLPVSLWGTEKIFQKESSFPHSIPLTIRIGEVIPAPVSSKREALQEVTDYCTKIINGLHALGR
jgi:1-acyl-sn-glycerol-3-phosphate acyltransferase